MLNLGIDPGKSGGMALIDKYGDFLEYQAFKPTKENAFDVDLFCDLIITWKTKHSEWITWVEKLHGRPSQSSVATFTFGSNYGQIIGALSAYNYDITYVHPITWTKVIHADAPRAYDSKSKSLWVAEKLWPGLDLRATKRSRKPHDGIVDAMLIAEYGRRQACEGPQH